MRRKDAWPVSGLLCLLMLFSCSLTWAGDPGQDLLAFSRDGWIWTCDGHGRSVRKLSAGVLPGVAPDGRRVAFFRPARNQDFPDYAQLWIHAGDQEALLAESMLPGSAPVWHPDGARLAFLARDDQARTLVLAIDLVDGKQHVLFSEQTDNTGFLCALAATADGFLLLHDMDSAYWLDWEGEVTARVALKDIMGGKAAQVTSADRLAPCPADPSLLVFSHAIAGTKVFEKIMHEPSSALSLHDRWTGLGKNMQITPVEVTAFDPVWSADGKRIYFIGYRDTQAADQDLFRIFRVDRFGSGLREVTRGEGVSAGLR